MNHGKVFPVLLLFLFLFNDIFSEDGYRLWLRYDIVRDARLLSEYNRSVTGILASGNSETVDAALRELTTGLEGLLGHKVPAVNKITLPDFTKSRLPGDTLEPRSILSALPLFLKNVLNRTMK